MDNIILKNKNLLITSVSSKIPLITAVREQLVDTGVKIILADCDKNCLASNLDLDFWQMPLLKNLSVDALVDFCGSKNIKFILPTRNGELSYFAKIKNELKDNGIFVMVSDSSSLETCLDKLRYYKTLTEKGINVIKTSDDIDDFEGVEKFAVKERYGAGSKGLKLNAPKEEALAHAKKLEAPIFQPYISGIEYSADSFFDIELNKTEILIRKRILVKDGEAQVTECVENADMNAKITELLKTLKVSGHSVSQFLQTKDGEIFIIETNPRVGGATPLAFKCGMHSIKWFIYSCLGYEIRKEKEYKKLKMVRVPKDLFYDINF